MAEEDKQSKTEQPTGKRRSDSEKKSGPPRSKELSSALTLMASFLFLYIAGSSMQGNMKNYCIELFRDAGTLTLTQAAANRAATAAPIAQNKNPHRRQRNNVTIPTGIGRSEKTAIMKWVSSVVTSRNAPTAKARNKHPGPLRDSGESTLPTSFGGWYGFSGMGSWMLLDGSSLNQPLVRLAFHD